MNQSKRKFLSFTGRLSLLFTISLCGGKIWKNFPEENREEDLVLVNGWVLKKSDLI